MSDSGVMVNVLLPDTFNRIEGVVKNELSNDSAIGVASAVWGFVGSAATDAIRRRLSFDVVEVLGRGWVFARELHEYKDTNKHPPGESSIVYLGQHKMKTELYPVLTLMIGPIKRELRFTLETTARINSVALSILNGHITGLGAGDCFVEAQLKYREIALHAPIKARKVTLPGRHDFEAPGLPIV
jgi:hypothetical protein